MLEIQQEMKQELVKAFEKLNQHCN